MRSLQSQPMPPANNQFSIHHRLVLVVLMCALIIAAYIVASLLFNFWPFERSAVAPTMEESEISDPASNWQTYRNEKYGFELQIPIDWTVSTIQEDDPENPAILFTSSETKRFAKENAVNCARPNPDNCIVEGFGYNLVFQPKSATQDITNIDAPAFNGIEFIAYSESGLVDIYHFKTIHNKKTYDFSAPTPLNPLIPNKILPTFKFIGSISQLDETTTTIPKISSAVSSQKIYKNTRYRFQLEYPREFNFTQFNFDGPSSLARIDKIRPNLLSTRADSRPFSEILLKDELVIDLIYHGNDYHAKVDDTYKQVCIDSEPSACEIISESPTLLLRRYNLSRENTFGNKTIQYEFFYKPKSQLFTLTFTFNPKTTQIKTIESIYKSFRFF